MARSESKKPSAAPAETRGAARSRTRRAKQVPQEPEAIAQSAALRSTDAPPAAATAPGDPAAATASASTTARKRRFDIFIVDVGWHSPIAESVRENIRICLQYQSESNATVYVLNPEQCVKLFKNHPSMIGTEPSVIVIDRDAYAARRKRGYGFKLNLGLIRDKGSANNLLKWVLAVLAEQRSGSDITEPIRTVIHKEGLRGAVDILADIAHSPVSEAMTH